MKKLIIVCLSLMIIIFGAAWLYAFLIRGKSYEINAVGEAEVTKFYIYGTTLAIEGLLNYEMSIEEEADVKLVFINSKEETFYDLLCHYEFGNLYFTTSSYLNEGINLEGLVPKNYQIFLSINGEYYALINESNYENVDYYTISNNNRTNYFNFLFKKTKILLNGGYRTKEYMVLKWKKMKIPKDVYDVTIDPGHGGIDPGAGAMVNVKESEQVLEISKLLKMKLENLGLKVKLTREGDYIPGNRNTNDPYGKDGRVNVSYETKSKFLLSVHLNSDYTLLDVGGVEIYTPNDVNYSFAYSLASSIVEKANTKYSFKEPDKIMNGVYYRYLNNKDIIEGKKSALNDGYEAYPIQSNTPYYFILRETGGIMTKAYVDGRDSRVQENAYRNANFGAESYLLELGYLVYSKDLENIKTNKGGYVDGISEALISHITSLQVKK